MIFPTLHLNGTSKSDLLGGWLKMNRALEEAVVTLIQEGPNARDYYVQGDADFTKARTEHEARIKKIKDVKEEIYAICEHIADAEGGRP